MHEVAPMGSDTQQESTRQLRLVHNRAPESQQALTHLSRQQILEVVAELDGGDLFADVAHPKFDGATIRPCEKDADGIVQQYEILDRINTARNYCTD